MRHSLVPAGLRYADQVARSGSIQKAARELHVAASAINRQILHLEEELGVPLFERLPRGMRLTPSGDALITLARHWRQDERAVIAEIRRIQELVGLETSTVLTCHGHQVMSAAVLRSFRLYNLQLRCGLQLYLINYCICFLLFRQLLSLHVVHGVFLGNLGLAFLALYFFVR